MQVNNVEIGNFLSSFTVLNYKFVIVVIVSCLDFSVFLSEMRLMKCIYNFTFKFSFRKSTRSIDEFWPFAETRRQDFKPFWNFAVLFYYYYPYTYARPINMYFMEEKVPAK